MCTTLIPVKPRIGTLQTYSLPQTKARSAYLAVVALSHIVSPPFELAHIFGSTRFHWFLAAGGGRNSPLFNALVIHQAVSPVSADRSLSSSSYYSAGIPLKIWLTTLHTGSWSFGERAFRS